MKHILIEPRNLAVAAIAVVAMFTAGCSTPPSYQTVGIAAGAVVGGVAGNLIFDSALGTVGGAAIGAVVGNEVSKSR